MMITDIETQTSGPYLHVAARGGTRRERTAGIGATVRGRNLRRVRVVHSETYGFLPATYATYGPR